MTRGEHILQPVVRQLADNLAREDFACNCPAVTLVVVCKVDVRIAHKERLCAKKTESE
jgi:hypothetical protein